MVGSRKEKRGEEEDEGCERKEGGGASASAAVNVRGCDALLASTAVSRETYITYYEQELDAAIKQSLFKLRISGSMQCMRDGFDVSILFHLIILLSRNPIPFHPPVSTSPLKY